jgi:hypothetical protein
MLPCDRVDIPYPRLRTLGRKVRILAPGARMGLQLEAAATTHVRSARGLKAVVNYSAGPPAPRPINCDRSDNGLRLSFSAPGSVASNKTDRAVPHPTRTRTPDATHWKSVAYQAEVEILSAAQAAFDEGQLELLKYPALVRA